jgi:flagellar motor switch protein FliG
MKRDREVKPFAWPSTEPEIPARAATAASVESSVTPEKRPPVSAPASRPEDALPEGIDADSTHAFLWEHAADAAAVLRTMMQSNQAGTEDPALQGMTARQLAAALMAGLGIDVGTRIMRHLPGEAEARWVGQALAEEPEVTHRLALAALQAVRQRIEAGDYNEAGGANYAAQLLESAFYRGRVSRLLSKTSDEGTGFKAFKELPAEQIAPYISHEHPQTIAMCLTQLDAGLASGILAQLPERMQADVAYRMTTMETVTPEAMIELEEALEASFRDLLRGSRRVGGPKVLADVLNLTGSSVEKNVLDQMDAQDPQVAESVRNEMFVFADLDKMTDRELQIILREVDSKDLVISLKACGEGLRQRLLQNLSEKARALIVSEMEQLGPMRMSEAEVVQLRIVQSVRQLEEQGKVTIVRGDTDDVWI